MNVYAISSLSASVLCVIVGSLAYASRNSKAHSALIGITFLIGVWTIFPFLTTIILDEFFRLRLARLIYIAAAPVPFAFLYLTLAVIDTSLSSTEKALVLVCKLATLLFMALTFHPNYIAAVGENHGVRFVIPGDFFPLFMVYFISICGWTFWRLIVEYPRTSGLKKNQIKYFFLGFIFAYVAGAIHFLTSYVQYEPIPHDFLVAVFILIIGYAILRFRLMDFNLMMRYGLGYGISIIVIVGLFMVSVFPLETIILENNPSFSGMPTIAMACIAVLMFETVRVQIARIVDRLIFRSPDFQALLRDFDRELQSSVSIPNMVFGLSRQFELILKSNRAGFVIWNSQKSNFDLMPFDAFNGTPLSKQNELLQKNDFLIKTLESERRLFRYGIILDEEVDALHQRSSPGERATFAKIRRTMRWLDAAAVVPLMSDQHLLGFIVLGEKRNGSLYNDEDRKFLSHVATIISSRIISLTIGENPSDQINYVPSQA